MKFAISAITLFVLFGFVVVGRADTVTVGFDGGSDGGFIGNALFEATGGNPGGTARFDPMFDLFFTELRTGGVGEPTNSAFIGDFSSYSSVTFSFDVLVESITDFIGNEISRPFGVMLIDRDIQGPSGPSGVFFETQFWSSQIQTDWTTYSVTIDDPTSATLPSGWIGFGDEDPITFETILPAGATFATVLAGVDEFRLTGAVPGFFFTNAFYSARLDNISVTTVPEPSSVGFIGLMGLAGVGFRQRRKR
jgi:hypothetical protein